MGKQLKIELIVDDKGSVHVKKFGDTADKSMKQAERSTSGLQKAVVGLASAYGLLKLGRMAADWAKLAGAQEQSEAQLRQAMVSMGRYSEKSFLSMKQLASGLQEVTTFGDEATMAGQKFLMTYKDIPDDLLPRTTKAMLDLAALMGGDTKQAANMLGKASMGLAGELRRVGITIDEDIAHSGDFARILGEIEKQVGGQARALAETGYGGLQQYGNLIGDVKEDLGDLVIKLVRDFDPAIRTFIDQLEQIADYWGKVFGGGGGSPTVNRLREQKNEIEAELEEWKQALVGRAKDPSAFEYVYGDLSDEQVNAYTRALQARLQLVKKSIEAETASTAKPGLKGALPAGADGTATAAGKKGKEEDPWAWQLEMAKGHDAAMRSLVDSYTAAYIDEINERKEADMSAWDWQLEMAEASDETYRAMEEEHTAKYIEELEKRKEAEKATAELRAETVKNMLSGMQGDLAGFFRDAFTGELKSASDYFQAFADTLFSIFARLCAKLIIEWIAVRIAMAAATGGASEAMGGSAGGLGSIIGGALGLFHTGGMGNMPVPTRRVPALAFAGGPRAHMGMFPDEAPVIIKPREEAVITRSDMAAIKTLAMQAASGGGRGPVHVHVNLDGREIVHAVADVTEADRHARRHLQKGLKI